MKMGFGLVLPLRIVQVVLSLVVLGLSGYGTLSLPWSPVEGKISRCGRWWTNRNAVAHWYNVDTLTASPTQINFLIFAGIWSILSVGYLELVTRFFPRGKLLASLSSSSVSIRTY